MNISKINNINFGIKFSDKAENLFQKSQDYVADLHDDILVIRNNLNREIIENALSDDFFLDVQQQNAKVNKNTFIFSIKHKNFNMCKFRKTTTEDNVLNGNIWNTIAEKLIKKIETTKNFR